VCTGSGSRTSHAAVVARELGKPCLVGCTELELDLTRRTATIGGRRIGVGEAVCLDAESGLVLAGSQEDRDRPTAAPDEVLAWRLGVADDDGGHVEPGGSADTSSSRRAVS
jgi:pyruvate,orthophosphate dikinase